MVKKCFACLIFLDNFKFVGNMWQVLRKRNKTLNYVANGLEYNIDKTVAQKTFTFPFPNTSNCSSEHMNCTQYDSLKDGDIWPYLMGIIICLSIVTTIFNLGIIVSYIIRPRIRLVLKVFVFNLCLVDFQNGCIALPLTAVYPRGMAHIWGPTLSGPACVFVTFWPTSLVITAYLSIILVTAERFAAILFPMKFNKVVSTKSCIFVVVCIWMYSCLYSFAPAFAISSPPPRYEYVEGCNGRYVYSEPYVDFFIYGILCIPLIFVIIMYLTMYCVARRHLKDIAAVTLPDPMRTQKDKKLLHHSKAAKTTFIMTFIFVVCWLPFLIIMLLSDLCNFDTCPGFTTPEALMYWRVGTTCLAFLNSALNPWIYGYRNPVIQVEMRAMVCNKKRTATVSVVPYSGTCDTKKELQLQSCQTRKTTY